VQVPLSMFADITPMAVEATGQVGVGPLLYAFTLGLVAAVNPCGFPLLPAYLAMFAGEGPSAGHVKQTVRGLVAGASVSAGFVMVFGIVGVAVESGAGVVISWAPWAMVVLGAALAVFGVLVCVGREPHVRLPVPRVRVPQRDSVGSPRRAAAMAGFGVAYAVASLSCALPLFLAGVAGAFTRLGFVAGVGTFIAYALGMGLLLMVASLVVAHAGTSALRRALPFSRFVPRVAGAVLALVGAYLVLYWVTDLAAPLAVPPPVRVVEQAQSALSNWLASSPRLIGAILGAVVVVALVLLALARPVPGSGRAQVAHKAGAANEPQAGAANEPQAGERRAISDG